MVSRASLEATEDGETWEPAKDEVTENPTTPGDEEEARAMAVADATTKGFMVVVIRFDLFDSTRV